MSSLHFGIRIYAYFTWLIMEMFLLGKRTQETGEEKELYQDRP